MKTMTVFEQLDFLRERRTYVNERKEAAFERFEAQYPDWFMNESDDYVKTCADWRKYFRWYKVSIMIGDRIDKLLDELLKQINI